MPQVKGNIVRVWARRAEQDGLLARVRSRLTAASLQTLTQPPLSASWVDSAPLVELFTGVFEVAGRDVALKLSRDTHREIMPVYAGMMGSLMRLFNASPASLFARLNDFVKQTMTGVEYRWRATSERAGVLEVEYTEGAAVNPVQFLAMLATFEGIYKLCGVNGAIADPVIISPRSARFALSW